MSQLAVGVPDQLVQCQNVSIAWSGPDGLDKTIQIFVRGTNFFAETLDNGNDLSGAAGSFGWTVDIPAGLEIAVEIRNQNATIWNTTPFKTILPGTTGDCLGKNTGQLQAATMSSFASSLMSASPTLFTYLSTAAPSMTTTAPPPPPTANATLPGNSITSAPTSSATAESSSSGISSGAIAGTAIGAAAALGVIALLVLFFCRKHRSSTTTGDNMTERETTYMPGGSNAGQDPVNEWRSAMAHRPPSTGTYAHTPASPKLESVAPYHSGRMVPEVYDESAYGSANSRGGNGYGYHAANANGSMVDLANRAPPTQYFTGAAEVMDEERPPTRMTTPGRAFFNS